MYEFAYCFAINGRVNWSAETADSLSRWIEDEEDQERVTEFIEQSQPGHFISLKDGTLLFRCSESPVKPPAPSPRPLMNVLDDAGLLDN